MKQILYSRGAILATILLSSITELYALQDNRILGTNLIQIANLEDIADDDMKNAEIITDTNQNIEIAGDQQDSAEDEEDGNLQTKHMPGEEMDQGDILEFSADVLGDTPPEEEKQDKEQQQQQKRQVAQKPKKASQSQHKKVATKAKLVKVVKPKKQAHVSVVQLKKPITPIAAVEKLSLPAEDNSAHLQKMSDAKMQLQKEQEEIARIEMMENQEELKAKEEEKSQVQALLDLKQKKAKFAATRLKETKDKIAKLKQGSVQQAHLFVHVTEETKKAPSQANVTNITFAATNVNETMKSNVTVLKQSRKKVEVEKNVSVNASRAQITHQTLKKLNTTSNEAAQSNQSTKIGVLKNNTQALSAKKVENNALQDKIAQIKARTAELKAQTARQKAKIMELHHHNESSSNSTANTTTEKESTKPTVNQTFTNLNDTTQLTQSNGSAFSNVTVNISSNVSQNKTLNLTVNSTSNSSKVNKSSNATTLVATNLTKNLTSNVSKNESLIVSNQSVKADLTNEITAKIDDLLSAKKSVNATQQNSSGNSLSQKVKNDKKKESVKKISLVKISTNTNQQVNTSASTNKTTNVTSQSPKSAVKPEFSNKTSNSSLAQSTTKVNTFHLININKVKEQKKIAVKQLKVKNLIQSVIQKNKPSRKIELKPKSSLKAIANSESTGEEQMPAAEEEGPEPTQEQILAVRKAMNLESQNAIDEGLEQTENDKKTQEDEGEVNERAAAEAAKDLVDDPTAEQEGQELSQKEGQRTEASAADIEKAETLGNLLRSNGLHNLAQSTSGLDSLIGASSALEMADGDPEYLKRYSEKIAMEADESDNQQKVHDDLVDKARQKIKQKKEEQNSNVLTVAKAREQAALVTAQMQAGVQAAEARKVLADNQIAMIQKQAHQRQQSKRNRKIKSSGPLPNGFEI